MKLDYFAVMPQMPNKNMLATAVRAALVGPVFMLGGCASFFNPPDSFYEAQAAVKVAKIQAEALPTFTASCESCSFSYRGEIKTGDIVDEGYRGPEMVKDVAGTVAVPAAATIAVVKAVGAAGDKIVNGDGNDLSESREYNSSSGEASRIDSANNKQDSTTPQQVTTTDQAVVIRPEVVTTPAAQIVTAPVQVVNPPQAQVVETSVTNNDYTVYP